MITPCDLTEKLMRTNHHKLRSTFTRRRRRRRRHVCGPCE